MDGSRGAVSLTGLPGGSLHRSTNQRLSPTSTMILLRYSNTAFSLCFMAKDGLTVENRPCAHLTGFEVAVGTTIADRPPHGSARALISACGSYRR